MQDFQKILKLLVENDVQFALIGGLAAAAHGSSILTEDIDFCISFEESNIANLLKALDNIHAVHRLIGKTKPLTENANNLSTFKNLYLKTDLGYIDFLSEVIGVGKFKAVVENSVDMKIFDIPCKVLNIDSLIKSKKEMKRQKDIETIKQLKAIKIGNNS